MLSDKQVGDLLSKSLSINKKHYLIIKCFIETGIKVSELINLKVTDVSNGELRIDSRRIKISKQFEKELRDLDSDREMLFESQKDNKVFRKDTIINMVNWYSVATKSIGHPIGTYSLRRFFISKCLKRNVSNERLAYF